MESCSACGRPARGLVLAKSSEEMVGPGMAVWMPTWTCESLHRASDLVPQIEKYDPGALVLSFAGKLYNGDGNLYSDDFAPGSYDAIWAGKHE
jgi:hypothetical protein